MLFADDLIANPSVRKGRMIVSFFLDFILDHSS